MSETTEQANILVVDDTPANLDLLSNVLAARGYRFRVATNGERALSVARTVHPDLVMLDITMPGMDGYEVCRRLKSEPDTAGIPVIFISALGEALDKVRAFEAGGADYVSKPFQFEEVLARVDNQLQLARLRKKLETRNAELAAKNAKLTDVLGQLEAANSELARLSTTDALTGIANRRHFHDVFDREWRRCRREGGPISVLMADVDYFKQYNDTYGHQKGDLCLASVASAFRSALQRGGDFVARYGGEELVVVLPMTGAAHARAMAERLCAGVRALAIVHERSAAAPHVTISVGVATAEPGAEGTPETLVSAADDALYRAKRNGRDRVESGPG